MSTFTVDLFSAHSLASTCYAQEAYDILNSWEFPPDVFDKYEPIRRPWKKRDDFIAAWEAQSKLHFGQVLTQRKKQIRYHADVMFQFGPNEREENKPPYHGFSVYDVKGSDCRDKTLNKLVELADRLFAALQMDYGFICLRDEYYARNVIKDVRYPDGSLEPVHVIGMNWPYYLPGFYWINYYGTRYLERGFGAGIETSFPSHVTKIEAGIRFQASENPRFFECPGAQEIEARMRDALGRDWFFDRKKDADKFCVPRDHQWLDVSLDELRSPK